MSAAAPAIFGNGVIEGKAGAQGSVEQFRELLRRNPTVPMAAEYGPHSIAFAVRWPLRYQQVWGGEATRIHWMTHQRPVSAFIHGPHHGAWVPTIQAESNFLRHVVTACSDALGGPAQCPGTLESLQANQGMLVHMRWRAQLFSRKQLEPFFAPNAGNRPWPVCTRTATARSTSTMPTSRRSACSAPTAASCTPASRASTATRPA